MEFAWFLQCLIEYYFGVPKFFQLNLKKEYVKGIQIKQLIISLSNLINDG